MADIVIFFLELANNTKVYHWMTTCFAKHKASDELFESIINISDEFMETMMGKYGRPKLSVSSKLTLKTLNDKTVIEYYKACIVYLETSFTNTLDTKTDTDLLNLRDELLGKLKKTLYLFTLS
jgi:DNA-binding ferritin-like protein